MNINKVFLFGNLTRDPEVRALPTGTQVAQLGIATNRTWKDKEGKKQEAVEYHNVVSFGRQADVIAQYARKGSSLFIEGRLQTRSWDDKNSGEKKYRTEIVLENFQFGPKRGTSTGFSKDSVPNEPTEEEEINYPQTESSDDIPF